MSREVVVVSGVRTAIGTFGGSLKDIPTTDLAALVAAMAMSATVALILEKAASAVVAKTSASAAASSASKRRSPSSATRAERITLLPK